MATSQQHHELCNAAGKWLRRSAVYFEDEDYFRGPRKVSCGVVLTELVTSIAETPDAIGWFCGGRYSILVEAKVSRSDFLADRRKRFRKRPELGVGQWRYYLAPVGMLSVDELPEKWGLLVSDGRRIAIAKVAMRQPQYHTENEKWMLWSFARRVQARKEQVALPVQ